MLHHLWVSGEAYEPLDNRSRITVGGVTQKAQTKSFPERKAKAPKPSSGDCVHRQAHFHRKVKRRPIIRWQHRLKRERPTCTERKPLTKSADGRVATVVTTRRRKKYCPTKKQQNPLDSDRPSHGRIITTYLRMRRRTLWERFRWVPLAHPKTCAGISDGIDLRADAMGVQSLLWCLGACSALRAHRAIPLQTAFSRKLLR
jgi:hypothetical protein